MKKLALTLAIVLGMAFASFGQESAAGSRQGGGLFQMGAKSQNERGMGTREETPALPHNYDNTDPSAPLGSGIAVLVGLGAAYMVAKKRREE